VVDAAGHPVPDAVIAVVSSTVPFPEIALRCDADGRFALRLPHGRFVLRALAGGASGDAEVEAASRHEIVIRIDAES
jgi:hypothetical protein